MLAANEVSQYINNQIISGLVSHFRCYLNRSVRSCELSSYRFTSQPTHADHPAERPRKIFSSAQFCSTSRWISLFYFCAGWQGSESCWQRLSEISNANSDFVYFWTGGGDTPCLSSDWTAANRGACAAGSGRESYQSRSSRSRLPGAEHSRTPFC